jgi:hypothetical protein
MANKRVTVILGGMLGMIWLLSSPCAATEFYRYVDEKGVVTFTDDLSKVPESQREHIQGTAAISPSEPESPAEPSPAFAPSVPDPTPVPAVASDTFLAAEAEALSALKAALDQEFEAHGAETARLVEMSQNLVDNQSIDHYNAEVVRLNERIQIYQSQQAEYLRRVTAYNEALNHVAQGE